MRLDRLPLVVAVGGALRSAGTSGNLLDGDLPKQPQPDPKTCLMIIKYVLVVADWNM